jgi:hypothetical protein
MANFFYAHAVTEHVLGNLSWSASMVARAVGVNEDIGRHTPDQMAHAFLSDIDVADQVAISPPLENKEALLDGVFAADPSFFEAVPAGDGVVISAVVIYYEIGDPTTSPIWRACLRSRTGRTSTSRGTLAPIASDASDVGSSGRGLRLQP